MRFQELEARENPTTIPTALTNFPSLLSNVSLSSEYAETHDISKSSVTTQTVDQQGTGTSGTFTVTLDTTESHADAIVGGASGATAITTSGNLLVQTTSQMILTGTYSYGTFTVTGQTYTETTTYAATRNIETISTYGTGSSTHHDNTTQAGSTTVSFTVALDNNGNLIYTDYDSVVSDSYHHYVSTLNTSSMGGYMGAGLFETTTDTGFTSHTTGYGLAGTFTGNASSWTTNHIYIPNYYNGTPYETTYTTGYSNPIAGSIMLPPPNVELDDDITWRAGSLDAINYVFHGESSRTDTLDENATRRTNFMGTSVDVNDFESSTETAVSGHVIDDEPSTPTSGTETFHRDETFTDEQSATGSGSYIGGSANATYDTSMTSSVVVGNLLTTLNDFSTGLDEDNEPYELLYNATRATNGSVTTNNTYQFHDAGLGMVVTLATVSSSNNVGSIDHSWGTRNGIAFDQVNTKQETNPTSTTTLPTTTDVIPEADSMAATSPFRPIISSLIGSMAHLILNLQLGPISGGAIGRGPQVIYNAMVESAGKNGAEKVGRTQLTKMVLEDMMATAAATTNDPSATGTFTLTNKGDTVTTAMKTFDKARDEERKIERQAKKNGVIGFTVTSRDVEIEYAVDGAANANRSGKIAISYKIRVTYTGTTSAGIPFTRSFYSVHDTIVGENDNLKTMKLKN